MRREILAHFDDPGLRVDPLVREAVERLRAPVAS